MRNDLHSFSLGFVKHLTEACASQFLEVSQEWEIANRVATVETDNVYNMIAASKTLPY